jgi:hypothetical protein
MMEAASTSSTSTRLHGATSQKTAIFILVCLFVCCVRCMSASLAICAYIQFSFKSNILTKD